MSFRTIAIVAILFLSIWQAASAQSGKESDAVTGRQYNETGAQMNDHKSNSRDRAISGEGTLACKG
jgi:hypothetical protein